MLPIIASRAPRLSRATLVLAVLAALVAALLLPASPASSGAPDPQKDYHQIPNGCFGPARTSPQVPQGCRLTPWAWNRPTVVLWGDSHAWQNVPALIRAANAERVNLTAFVGGKCPPAKLRIRSSYPGLCEQSNALALKYVRKMSQRKQPVQVILGSNWAGFRQLARQLFVTKTKDPSEFSSFDRRMIRLFHRRTEKLFPALRETRARVSAIGQTATCSETTRTAPFYCTLPRRKAILHETRTRQWLNGHTRYLGAKQHVIEINGPFCGPVRCRGKVDGIYTFWDWGHLSKSRNRRMAFLFRPVMRSLRR